MYASSAWNNQKHVNELKLFQTPNPIKRWSAGLFLFYTSLFPKLVPHCPHVDNLQCTWQPSILDAKYSESASQMPTSQPYNSDRAEMKAKTDIENITEPFNKPCSINLFSAIIKQVQSKRRRLVWSRFSSFLSVLLIWKTKIENVRISRF